MNDNKCSKCRKYGQKLFLKGERCLLPKCALTRRANAPGKVASSGNKSKRRKKSEYGIQLEEKQKAKTQYGLRERQLRQNFSKAAASQEATGETLMQRLERRLDNVVYRLGWANSRAEAKQLVSHNHIQVNKKVVNIPSYLTTVHNIIEPADLEVIKKKMQEKANPPAWLKYDKKNYHAEVINLPARKDIETAIDEQLIVEYYSK